MLRSPARCSGEFCCLRSAPILLHADDYNRYRLYVLHRFPRLKFLDSKPVTEAEQKEAKRVGRLVRVAKPDASQVRQHMALLSRHHIVILNLTLYMHSLHCWLYSMRPRRLTRHPRRHRYRKACVVWTHSNRRSNDSAPHTAAVSINT